MANVLAGVQGILELNEPGQPLSPRDRQRLEAAVEEGMTTLGRARHLAMGTLPEALDQEGEDWRAQLADELMPMGTLFRCQFAISAEGAPDRWPGALLRSYLRAAIRQVLPYVHGNRLDLHLVSSATAWTITLSPVTLLPEGLFQAQEDRPGDISGRWAQHLGACLGEALSCTDEVLSLQVPRR